MEKQTRSLICEGRCNPYLADFDSVAHRQSQFGDVRDYMKVAARVLIHTEHIMTQDNHYDTRIGWCRKYTCVVCGHTRKF